jgi:hypothetical protein
MHTLSGSGRYLIFAMDLRTSFNLSASDDADGLLKRSNTNGNH